jgi:hypothetical protein
MVDYAVQFFEKELDQRLVQDYTLRHSLTIKRLQEQRSELAHQLTRLVEAIAAAGHSHALLTKLAESEKQMLEIEEQIRQLQSHNFKASTGEIRGYVTRALTDLASVFSENVYRARTELSRHITHLVLTPMQTPKGLTYEITGNWAVISSTARLELQCQPPPHPHRQEQS